MFTGSISNSPINYDVLTLKLQNNGTIDWHQLFGGNAGLYDGGTKIAKEGNNLYVSGITTGSFTQNNLDALILAYDLGGNLQWSNSYDASGFKDIGAGLVVSDEKIGLISGSEDSSNSYRIVLLEYDSSGTLLEENNITSSNIIIDELIDYSVDNNGNFYILGSKFDTSTAFDFLIIKMNPDFSIAWESSLSSEGQANDKASALAIDDSGYVYVSGSTIREQTSSFLIGKYSPTGNLE